MNRNKIYLSLRLAGCLSFGLLTACSGVNWKSWMNAHGKVVEKMTGGHTRVVWVQDTGSGGDTMAAGRTLRLMGYDSQDGKGERVILGDISSYTKPLLTSDGKRVIFTNRAQGKVNLVNFDGSGLRNVADGFGAETWTDPVTGKMYALVGKKLGGGKSSAITFSEIWRHNLDDPKDKILLWNTQIVEADSFQVSLNGSRAGGLFPWPHGGFANFKNKAWRRMGRGCWTSFAPDNSYLMWIFDGLHRNVYVYDTTSMKSWKVNINNARGVDGYEVYHPRWTNHAHHLVMTGPYKEGNGGNKIGGGGKDVEIYLGRFNHDLREVEDWVKITDNQSADFFPDAWIAGGDQAHLDHIVMKNTEDLHALSRAKSQLAGKSWPGITENLVFLWENSARENQVTNPATGQTRPCQLDLTGRSRFGPYHELELRRGAALPRGMDEALPRALKTSGEFTIEAVIHFESLPHGQPAWIISHASEKRDINFVLAQRNNELGFSLRTSNPGEHGPVHHIPAGHIQPGRATHIVISYQSGKLVCTIDGKPALDTDTVTGDLKLWVPGRFFLGDAFSGKFLSSGGLEGLAVYDRFLTAYDANAKYGLYRTRFEEREKRQPITVKARLKETSLVPSPAGIVPYRRCLVAGVYEVEKVEKGALAEKRIVVYHWGLMDGKVLEDAKRKPGKVYRMTLESFDDHPQLRGERQAMDIMEFDLPTFYDLDS